MNQVVIIGGGASGLMAGITAAREGASVTILEKCEKPGKKLLATGNGRCNLTNFRQDPSCYHVEREQREKTERILSFESMEDTLSFFHSLGLWTKDREGWVYPRSDSAASVLQLLLQEFSRLKGKIKTNEEVTAVEKQKAGFMVFTGTWQYPADAVIVSSGTPASNIEGVSADALKIAESFGIRYRDFRPSLVPLKCRRENYFAKWAGVRCRAELSLILDGDVLQKEEGELQLTDYGISGIPVFQLSSLAGKLLEDGKKPSIRINFLPEFQREELEKELERIKEQNPEKRPVQLLSGLLPEKLLSALAGKKTTTEQLLDQLLGCSLTIASLGPLKQAQVCAGGILLEELTERMEAKQVPGLYFTGECTDMDGRCGGYNLQWAWSTGAAAGKAAAGRKE